MNLPTESERKLYKLPSRLPSGTRCLHPNDGRAFFFVTDPDVSYEKACAECLIRELGPEKADAVGAGGLPYCQFCEDGVAQVIWDLQDEKSHALLYVALCVQCVDSLAPQTAFVRVMDAAGVIEISYREP